MKRNQIQIHKFRTTKEIKLMTENEMLKNEVAFLRKLLLSISTERVTK